MSHLCILFVYKNVEDVKKCFDSLYLNDIDFWVVENHSENSNQIQEYFTSTGLIKKYFYFKENITSNAMQKIVRDFSSEIAQYDFLTITDCDLVVDDPRKAFNEVIKNASFDEVAFSCIDLKLENFPHNIPNSWKWLPSPTAHTQEYIECPTGGHLMTVRKEMLDFVLEAPYMTDSIMYQNAIAKNKKWVKTIENKAYHLTWDLYKPDNPYYLEKASMTNDSWCHHRMCKYVEIQMVNHSKKSLDILQNISEQISSLTFHHHYHVLYDIPLPENPVYLEIGCYGGGSSCLMIQKPNIKVIAVDLGHPIDENVVKSNVSKLNNLHNEFHYVKANSHLEETVETVKQIAESVDLLFIDGDHTYYGVLTDFKLWAPLVKRGGYIVFDDYNDAIHSPEVKIAVDDIFSKPREYQIIGCLKNVYGARPAELVEGNCFIVRKL